MLSKESEGRTLTYLALFCAAIQAYFSVRGPIAASQQTSMPWSTQSLISNYWPIAAMVVLIGLNFIASARWKVQRGRGPFLYGQLIIGNGGGLNISFQTLNGAALRDFRREYKVAVICGITDAAADKFESTTISKSAAFTITSSL